LVRGVVVIGEALEKYSPDFDDIGGEDINV
jgi:hypothetical protein